MDLFYHQIYEFQKGIRDLVLVTKGSKYKEIIEKKLIKEKIPYLLHEIENDKINVYFGKQECIEVVKSFKEPNLTLLNPQQDFILGIMLGYDRLQECERYLKLIS